MILLQHLKSLCSVSSLKYIWKLFCILRMKFLFGKQTFIFFYIKTKRKLRENHYFGLYKLHKQLWDLKSKMRQISAHQYARFFMKNVKINFENQYAAPPRKWDTAFLVFRRYWWSLRQILMIKMRQFSLKLVRCKAFHFIGFFEKEIVIVKKSTKKPFWLAIFIFCYPLSMEWVFFPCKWKKKSNFDQKTLCGFVCGFSWSELLFVIDNEFSR